MDGRINCLYAWKLPSWNSESPDAQHLLYVIQRLDGEPAEDIRLALAELYLLLDCAHQLLLH